MAQRSSYPNITATIVAVSLSLLDGKRQIEHNNAALQKGRKDDSANRSQKGKCNGSSSRVSVLFFIRNLLLL